MPVRMEPEFTRLIRMIETMATKEFGGKMSNGGEREMFENIKYMSSVHSGRMEKDVSRFVTRLNKAEKAKNSFIKQKSRVKHITSENANDFIQDLSVAELDELKGDHYAYRNSYVVLDDALIALEETLSNIRLHNHVKLSSKMANVLEEFKRHPKTMKNALSLLASFRLPKDGRGLYKRFKYAPLAYIFYLAFVVEFSNDFNWVHFRNGGERLEYAKEIAKTHHMLYGIGGKIITTTTKKTPYSDFDKLYISNNLMRNFNNMLYPDNTIPERELINEKMTPFETLQIEEIELRSMFRDIFKNEAKLTPSRGETEQYDENEKALFLKLNLYEHHYNMFFVHRDKITYKLIGVAILNFKKMTSLNNELQDHFDLAIEKGSIKDIVDIRNEHNRIANDRELERYINQLIMLKKEVESSRHSLQSEPAGEMMRVFDLYNGMPKSERNNIAMGYASEFIKTSVANGKWKNANGPVGDIQSLGVVPTPRTSPQQGRNSRYRPVRSMPLEHKRFFFSEYISLGGEGGDDEEEEEEWGVSTIPLTTLTARERLTTEDTRKMNDIILAHPKQKKNKFTAFIIAIMGAIMRYIYNYIFSLSKEMYSDINNAIAETLVVTKKEMMKLITSKTYWVGKIIEQKPGIWGGLKHLAKAGYKLIKKEDACVMCELYKTYTFDEVYKEVLSGAFNVTTELVETAKMVSKNTWNTKIGIVVLKYKHYPGLATLAQTTKVTVLNLIDKSEKLTIDALQAIQRDTTALYYGYALSIILPLLLYFRSDITRLAMGLTLKGLKGIKGKVFKKGEITVLDFDALGAIAQDKY